MLVFLSNLGMGGSHGAAGWSLYQDAFVSVLLAELPTGDPFGSGIVSTVISSRELTPAQ